MNGVTLRDTGCSFPCTSRGSGLTCFNRCLNRCSRRGLFRVRRLWRIIGNKIGRDGGTGGGEIYSAVEASGFVGHGGRRTRCNSATRYIRDYHLLLSHAFLPSANIICATKLKSTVKKKIYARPLLGSWCNGSILLDSMIPGRASITPAAAFWFRFVSRSMSSWW
jgi:hypothetical protein